MEQKKQIDDELYPWLIGFNLDDDSGDQFFFNINDPINSRYRCRIPELSERLIRGCFHGWTILSKANRVEPCSIEWSVWNPITSKLIHLPRMILKDDEDDIFRYVCLSSPPDDPSRNSIVLLMDGYNPNIVFFNCKRRKRLRRWTKMSYSKQMKNIISSFDNHVLSETVCCNGKIYAWCDVSSPPLLIEIQIDVVKKKQVVINLVPLVKLASHSAEAEWHWQTCEFFLKASCTQLFTITVKLASHSAEAEWHWQTCEFFLKASCTQLFTITLCLDEGKKPCHMNLFQLDMRTMVWTEINDLKDTAFFVCTKGDEEVVYSSPPMGSKLGGGYVHLLEERDNDIYSFNINDKTISLSSMRRFDHDSPLFLFSMWTVGIPPAEYIRLYAKPINGDDDDDDDNDQMHTPTTAINDDDDQMQTPTTAINDDDDQMHTSIMNDGDDQMMIQLTSATDTATNDDDMMNDSCLLNIPFDLLKTIMEFCVGVEYLNFRATCKLCRLGAPMIQWSNERMRLQTYSLLSPWLMVLDKNRGIITFTDPMYMATYFIKPSTPSFFVYYDKAMCCRYGWLLFYIDECQMAFFNPFTSDIRKIPPLLPDIYDTFSFSAPPTSPDCTVVVIKSSSQYTTQVYVHLVGREAFWRNISLTFKGDFSYSSSFPIFCGKDVYTVRRGGELEVYREVDDNDKFAWKRIASGPTKSKSYWLHKVYHVKCDQHHLVVTMGEFGKGIEVFKLMNRKWEKIDGLGSHVIYICDASCVCMEAKIPEMKNKIYFPKLHSKNDKIVFYSLETKLFHTSVDYEEEEEENILTNFYGTKKTVYAHAWIQPTWSY